MKKIIMFTLLIIFVLTSTTFAFFGLVDDVVESNTPQPMYRVPNGQEVEYMAKTIKQVQLLINTVDNIQRLEEQGMDQQAMMGKMLGNDQLASIVGNDISDLSAEDWENIMWDKINDLFSQLNNTVENVEELPEETENEIKKEVEKRVKSPVDVVLNDLESQIEDGNIQTYSREEKEEVFREKVKELEDKLDLTVEYYVEVDKNYGENSNYENYIKSEEETLNNLANELGNNLENASLPMTMKSLNVLMLQNNRINLKTLKALSDLNEQIGRIGETYHKNNIGDEFKNIDRKFNN